MDNEQYDQKILEIKKENRILAKKLRRSQINLVMSEETNDRIESLLTQVISDLRQSESTLALNSKENARLYQQSQKNAQQLQVALNELIIHEAQVQGQNEQLAKAARLKDEFLATISHELGKFFNCILGYSQILLEEVIGSLNDKQLQAIAQIDNCGNHLL
jgi:signal transduction histidine kinase